MADKELQRKNHAHSDSDESVISQTLKEKLSLKPASEHAVDFSHFVGGLKFECRSVDRPFVWMDYSPCDIRHDDPLYRHKSDYVLSSNFHVLADFCADATSDVPRMVNALRSTYNTPKFELLLSGFAVEFRSVDFDKAYNLAVLDAQPKLTANIGTELQRNVSVLMVHVMKRLCKNKVITEEDFYCTQNDAHSLVKDMAASHTLDMIRSYVKLYCVERSNQSCVSENDQYEMWKSVLVQLALYAGVNVSMNGETTRYYLKNGERSITVKPDMEIMMRPCKPNFTNVLIPRLVVTVCGKKKEAETDEISNICAGDSGIPTSNTTTTNDDPHSSVLTSHSDPTKKECSAVSSSSTDDPSDAARKQNRSRGRRAHIALPECLCKGANAEDIAQIKNRLLRQHGTELLTVQQSLEYCSDGYQEDNVGKPVLGLFAKNEKIFFTKLTGNDNSGRKLTISNWCLNMDRFLDRILLMVFLRTYCTVPLNP